MKTTATAAGNSFGYESQDSVNEVHERESIIDLDYLIGLVLLATSFTLFILAKEKIFFNSFESSLFIFPYGIAIFYLVWLMVHGKIRVFWKKQPAAYLAHRLLLGFVWLVSCFALNLSLPIFNESTWWLSVAIVGSAITAIIFAWEQVLPQFVKKALFFFMSVSVVLWSYYAIYLSWVYPASVLGLLFLGISVHSFIPLLLCITHFRILFQNWVNYRSYILAGATLPLLFVIYFCVQWNSINKDIRDKSNEIATRPTEELPDWILLGQSIGTDWITKRVIMGDLVYQIPGEQFSMVPANLNTGELAQHDPLVLIASLFTPKTDLSQTERTKLLDVLFDSRHYTQERLWTGSDLKTDNVITQARIYPDFRLAYTEKTISIRSDARSDFQQEEALYTFYMPEGSVVSSLSLWIDGKEEKSRLTTQSKAATAYKTIVGVERRDPSVIHWQEGNAVTVKVFPCTPQENRKFRIGITSPLKFENNQLVYENVWFKGPDAGNATEMIKLDFTKSVNGLGVPFGLEEKGVNSMVSNGKYQSTWKARFEAVPVSSAGFTFDGKSYAMKPFDRASEVFSPINIYLDINKAWSKAEFDEVFTLFKNRPLYVFDEKFITISNANKNEIFEKLTEHNFSLFPVHQIQNRQHALLITKANLASPVLKDLEGSNFSKELSLDRDSIALKTFSFGEGLSPYLKTLNELRIIRCEQTDLPGMKKMVSLNQFPADQEKGDSTLRIDYSKMIIQETSDSTEQSAPDHLLRLFAYNHIMKETGRHYLDKSFQSDSILSKKLVQEAAQAHIVTPVSSMIVLETQKDYDRFDIKKSKNSLDNATLKSSGAVPEPHEWALILLFGMLVCYYTFRNYVRL